MTFSKNETKFCWGNLGKPSKGCAKNIDTDSLNVWEFMAPIFVTDALPYVAWYGVCVCVVIPFILDVKLVNASAGVTQDEGHTGFLHLPSAVLALIFLRTQPFLSLVDREVEFCVPTIQSFSTC